MKLNSYISMTGTPVAEFAEAIGRAPQTVWRWLNGSRVPSHADMRRIHEATDGAVTPNDWVLR